MIPKAFVCVIVIHIAFLGVSTRQIVVFAMPPSDDSSSDFSFASDAGFWDPVAADADVPGASCDDSAAVDVDSCVRVCDRVAGLVVVGWVVNPMD